jgi:hypothetical protein
VCDGGNRIDADYCRHCRAPITLAYHTSKQKQPPKLLTVLGGPEVGKTSYVGMLADILSRQSGGLQMLAHGAFSVSLQQQTMAALSRRRFPPPTPATPDGWHWVHCDLRSPDRRNVLELVLPDVSGAAIVEEIESPHRLPAIRRLFTKSAGAMILVETSRYETAEHDSEFIAMKIVGDLISIPARKRKGWSHRPVAIVFTKADRHDIVMDDPEDYARRYASSLWRQCNERLTRHRFFAVSIATVQIGRDGFGDHLDIPLRVEPHGVIEPFAWLTEQLS